MTSRFKPFYTLPLAMLLMLANYGEVAAQGIQEQEQSAGQETAVPENSTRHSELLSKDQPLPINARILSLITLSEESPLAAEKILPNIEAISEHFNIAEQYLMLIIKSDIALEKKQYQQVIDMLNGAIKLEEKMSEAQLSLPEFARIHFVLAEGYAKAEQYKLAYDQKLSYMKKYGKYRRDIHKKRLVKLNKKYETDIKVKENELLVSQQKLKALKLKQTEAQSDTQRRNIIILTVTALVFLVLLIRQYRIRAILHQLSQIDSLTGLFNRRTLFTKGEQLIDESIKSGEPISVIMLDADHFKKVNDTFGHDVGDKVIETIARLGQETMRSRDVFARLGGEEFAMILPATDLVEAKAIAERFREKVQQYELLENGIKHDITISAGVANIKQTAADFDAILHAADEAMYQAKNAGRNQVCSYINQEELQQN